jgi:cytochrome c biogenesis protein CcdA
MTDSLEQVLKHTIETNIWLAPFAALVGGLLTALNPCVIGSIPLMIAYIAGQETQSVKRSFLLSLTFVAGLTLMFGLMLLTALTASSFVSPVVWKYVAAAVCLIMGLHLMGVLSFTIPAPRGIKPAQKGFIGAVLLGMLFGLISLPCAGPILLALLSVGSMEGVSAATSVALLVAYSIGHCAMVLVAGTSMGFAQRMIASKGLQTANAWAKRGAGLLVFGLGLYLLLLT